MNTLLFGGTRKLRRISFELIQRLSEKNYYAAKAYHQWLLKRSIQKKKCKSEPILVYTMAKVGSESVLQSLRTVCIEHPIYKIHVLREGRLKELEKYIKVHPHARKLIWNSLYIRKWLDEGSCSRIKVITLVRDPIARNVSTFFQILYDQFGYNYNEKVRILSMKNILEELYELFFEKFAEHDIPIIWFDKELKSIFNIDVYSMDFPKSKGYMIYRVNNIELLLMRLENLNECAKKAFKEFLGIRDFKLLDANTGSRKDYYIIYKEFIKKVILPDAYLERMYNSKYVHHFYEPNEIETFRSKWTTGITSRPCEY
jgi:hypothetical protein